MSIFMSALSVNAESMASVTLDVVKNMTFGYLHMIPIKITIHTYYINNLIRIFKHY
jgi:hypothetical protein